MIKLDSVSVSYSAKAFSDRSLKTAVTNVFTNSSRDKDIIALQDISIQVKNGERIAILGHNGAGKSTLLKTIAGLYPPTRGTVATEGRIRALFELHLGFEMDATGRENIKYRALLLGAKPSEIRGIEQSVIEFIGLGRRIDSPLRTYSSGMMVRLAFGVATFFKGEILLLDEVIAAGDQQFFVKAKQKLLELIDSADILMVATHDLAAAEELCSRGIIIRNGIIVFDGDIKSATTRYISGEFDYVEN